MANDAFLRGSSEGVVVDPVVLVLYVSVCILNELERLTNSCGRAARRLPILQTLLVVSMFAVVDGLRRGQRVMF